MVVSTGDGSVVGSSKRRREASAADQRKKEEGSIEEEGQPRVGEDQRVFQMQPLAAGM